MDYDRNRLGTLYHAAGFIAVLRRFRALQNVLCVLMQCFTVACVMSLLWLTVGYSLAFSDGGSLSAFVGGLDSVLLAQAVGNTVSGTLPEGVFAPFQMTLPLLPLR